MSNALFPELPGLEWDTSITPMFNTKIMTSINGRELRASFQASPKYEISLSYAFLRENKSRKELQQLQGFFLERRGAFDSFLFKMPDDNQFNCTFIGDGVTSTFQIYKQIYETQIPVSNTESTTTEDPLMWDEDLDQPMWTDLNTRMWAMQYSVSKNGVLTLPVPLAAGDKVTVKGTFYYRCRFKDDTQEYVNFMHKLWKAGKVELIGSLGAKI
ncbi:DUF2460 domain-containing protein [Acinetobacter baumannii]